MWEITIVGKYEDKVYFDELESKLVSNKLNYKVMLSTAFVDGDYILSVATTSNRCEIIDFIKLCVTKTIIVIAKHDYFMSHLHISQISTELHRFIVDVLVTVDSEYELYYVMSRMSSGSINIRSLMWFKLKEVQHKWQRLCDTLMLEFRSLTPQEIYLDVLKYVVDVSTCSETTIDIDVVDNNYILKEGINVLNSIPISDDVDMMIKLINHQPKSVNILDMSKLPFNVYQVLSYIFSGKLQVII